MKTFEWFTLIYHLFLTHPRISIIESSQKKLCLFFFEKDPPGLFGQMSILDEFGLNRAGIGVRLSAGACSPLPSQQPSRGLPWEDENGRGRGERVVFF